MIYRNLAALVGVAALAAPVLALAQPSEAKFLEACSACHQPSGKGIPGAFPALAGDPFVKGPATQVVATVLNGRGGMPAWKIDLTDAQIAAAITYIRSAWGTAASAVTAEMVAAERAKATPAGERSQQAH